MQNPYELDPLTRDLGEAADARREERREKQLRFGVEEELPDIKPKEQPPDPEPRS